MKKVIRFMNLRVLFILISIVLIGGGIAGTIIRGGFNLGIDFQAGLSMRVQIAEEAFTIVYNGEGAASFNIDRDSISVAVTGTEENDAVYNFLFDDYRDLRSLRDALRSISGVDVDLHTSENKSANRLININSPIRDITDGYTAKILPQAEGEVFAPIDKIREALTSLGNAQITAVGPAINQEYLIRTQDSGDIENFSDVMSETIRISLGGYFAGSLVIVNQTDYVGPRFSQDLGRQTVYLVSIALFLILAYAWIRFKLGYAVSAIVALIHDALFMVGFIGAFQIEVSAATIAAVLTIIGYSINDTIVVYDRVRENSGLMRDTEFVTIINTSISQTMVRSLMTSFTTILAVTAIYIFSVGTVKIFALNMIVGVVVGTYSSMFIASPILLGWTKSKEKRKKKSDLKKYGKPLDKPAAQVKVIEEISENGNGQPTEKKQNSTSVKTMSVERDQTTAVPQIIERKPPKPKKKTKKR